MPTLHFSQHQVPRLCANLHQKLHVRRIDHVAVRRPQQIPTSVQPCVFGIALCQHG